MFPRDEASQGQLGPSSGGDTGLLGHSHCLLTKMEVVGWGGVGWAVSLDRHGREVAGRRPCSRAQGNPGPPSLLPGSLALSGSTQRTPGAELLTLASHSGGKRDEARPDAPVPHIYQP